MQAMGKSAFRRYGVLLAAALGVAAVGGGIHAWRTRRDANAGRVYTAAGFGGYVVPAARRAVAPISVEAMLAAYDAGRYAEVERIGPGVLKASAEAKDADAAYRGLQARSLLAYTAARRKDFSLARERFADLRDTAAQRPDKGVQKVSLGEVKPTFMEEGAFQHAVCTGVAQGQEAAEAEYREFLREYPQSVLIHAAVKRIARIHDGNLPRDAERLFEQAMAAQKRVETEQRKAAALCGPKCLAEWLRRVGTQADVAALTQELQTTEEGTTLLALAQAAKRHGLSVRGLELTEAGLRQQSLPLLAYLTPGHFVLVEAVTPEAVQYWDPDARGPGQAGSRTVSSAEWKQLWAGVALAR